LARMLVAFNKFGDEVSKGFKHGSLCSGVLVVDRKSHIASGRDRCKAGHRPRFLSC